MRLLVLGGTWFVGRAVAEAAVRRGWAVTCFNRGRTGRDVPGVETVRGDRTALGDVDRLAASGPWESVVDTGAYEPPGVAAVAQALAPVVDRYVVVSSVSAYRDWPAEPTTEDSPLWPAQLGARRRDLDAVGMAGAVAYGTLKAGCEAVVRATFEDRAVVVRPGVVLGPYEYVGRLDTLLSRAAQGGPMLVAGRPERAIQPVDVRDLAEFLLAVVADGHGGVFNVVAPEDHATYGELIGACVDAAGGGAGGRPDRPPKTAARSRLRTRQGWPPARGGHAGQSYLVSGCGALRGVLAGVGCG